MKRVFVAIAYAYLIICVLLHAKIVRNVHPLNSRFEITTDQATGLEWEQESGFLDASEWVGSPAVSLDRLKSYANAHGSTSSLWCINGTRVEHWAGAPSDWHWDCYVRTLLPRAAAVLNLSKPIWLLLGSMDEPANRVRSTCPHSVQTAHANVFGWPDRVTDEEAELLPFFSPAKIRGCHRDWLYPFGEICESQQVEVDGGITLWEERRTRAFWRGSSTGFGNLNTNHRVNIVRFLRRDSRRLHHDVGITSFAQGMAEDPELASPKSALSGWHVHKHLLDMGGNSYSRRLSLLAQLGSSLVVVNPFEDVFSRTLVHKKHVLRVEINGTNVADAFEWLRQNDARAKALGNSLTKHWKSRFNNDSLVLETANYLRLYAKTVRFI